MLKVALVVSMLFQLGAAVFAITLIRRTRYNISWILISAGLVLMAIRRLFDFSTLFWETNLFQREEINAWIGILISVFIFVGVIFIRKIFNLQDQVEKLRQESEHKILSVIINTEETERQTFFCPFVTLSSNIALNKKVLAEKIRRNLMLREYDVKETPAGKKTTFSIKFIKQNGEVVFSLIKK